MKTSISAVALASSLVACGNGGSPEQNTTIHQRSEPSRLTVNGPIHLGALGTGKWSDVAGINAVGQVVGTSDTGVRTRYGGYVSHAFVWQSDTGMIDLGTLGGSFSMAFDINGRGQV